MKIYTRTGDKGETGLIGGVRVPKNHPQIEAYGTVDELNAVLGIAATQTENNECVKCIQNIQLRLFSLGSDLAQSAETRKESDAKHYIPINEEDIKQLEKLIDTWEETLPPLRAFILPGGCAIGATLHHARCICRRAERRVLSAQENSINMNNLMYLNRLSDFLFVLARCMNAQEGSHEIEWTT